jgi:pilus assembly protein CpaC
MAGLLENKTDARNSSIPLLGDLPLIGPLFRSVRYQENQTELVVLVTAELVEPIDSVGNEPLPGFLHERPNDWQFFVDGRIEGTVVAPLPPSQAAQARKLGLDKLTGPGAWRRFDELPEPARPDLSVPPLPRSTGDDPGSDAEEGGTEVSI